MSDLRKITEGRKTERESSYGADKRKLKALEDIADALEGIRQDRLRAEACIAACVRTRDEGRHRPRAGPRGSAAERARRHPRDPPPRRQRPYRHRTGIRPKRDRVLGRCRGDAASDRPIRHSRA